jgi:hypothetical protein
VNRANSVPPFHLIQDKDSMLRLVQVIDQALGYVRRSIESLSWIK